MWAVRRSMRSPDAARHAAIAVCCAADPGSTRASASWVPALRSSANSAAPRPGHERALLPRPFRRAFFGKGLRAFDVILRRHHGFHRGVFALLGDRLLERDRKPLLNRLLGGADRHRAVLADRLGPTLGGRERFALRHHLVDEAEFEPFAGGDMARGEDHAHRALEPDLARQPVQAAGKRRKANARLGQSEGRILRSDDEIAGQRNLKTATHRYAVDGGDDRLVAIEARGEACKSALVPAALSAGRLPFQIVAGAEGLVARTRDD